MLDRLVELLPLDEGPPITSSPSVAEATASPCIAVGRRLRLDAVSLAGPEGCDLARADWPLSL
jgi:hypothetical protein